MNHQQKVPHVANTIACPIVVEDDPLLVFDPEGEEDMLESFIQYWLALEELSAMINVYFVKSLSGFDK